MVWSSINFQAENSAACGWAIIPPRVSKDPVSLGKARWWWKRFLSYGNSQSCCHGNIHCECLIQPLLKVLDQIPFSFHGESDKIPYAGSHPQRFWCWRPGVGLGLHMVKLPGGTDAAGHQGHLWAALAQPSWHSQRRLPRKETNVVK